MAFLEFRSWRGVRGVNFAHFPNVSVLMIRGAKFTEELVVDLSGLLYLRSLEISESSIVVHGFPKNLVFFILDCCFHPGNGGAIATEIEGLKELQSLHLIHYDGDKLPDLRNTTLLHKAKFLVCRNVVAVNGLSSTLRVLHFESSYELRSCVGVGDLVLLEELVCKDCLKLEVLPNLRRLRKLRILDISRCELITEVPGIGDLVALEELRATGCRKLLKLSDIRKVVNLRVLGLKYCESITVIPGLDSLISLEEIEVDFRAMVDNPNLGQLTKLRKVWIDGWSSAGVQGLSNLTTLHTLQIGYCRGMDELPDLQRLIQLQDVTIQNSVFKDVSSLSHSSALETLKIYGCAKLERLPTWQGLASLKGLKVVNCPGLTRWDPMVVEQVDGRLTMLEDSRVRVEVPNTELEWNLERLELGNCGLYDLRTFGSFPELERLEIESLRVNELPDLSDFPRLRHLELKNCESLERLTNRVPMKSLCELVMVACGSLIVLPDLCEEYPGLSLLTLRRCHGITSLSSSGPTRALTLLVVDSCNSLTAMPDLAMFPALEGLDLSGCMELKALSSSMPLASLTRLKVTSCQGLKAVSDLAMFPALEELDLNGSSELEALSISVPHLTALKRVDVRGCNRLRRDDVKLLRAVCLECVIVAREDEDQVDKGLSSVVGKGEFIGRIWRYRLVSWCGVIASIGIVVFTWKRKRITR